MRQNHLLMIRTTEKIHKDINTSFTLGISGHLEKPHQGYNTVTNSATRDQCSGAPQEPGKDFVTGKPHWLQSVALAVLRKHYKSTYQQVSSLQSQYLITTR